MCVFGHRNCVECWGLPYIYSRSVLIMALKAKKYRLIRICYYLVVSQTCPDGQAARHAWNRVAGPPYRPDRPIHRRGAIRLIAIWIAMSCNLRIALYGGTKFRESGGILFAFIYMGLFSTYASLSTRRPTGGNAHPVHTIDRSATHNQRQRRSLYIQSIVCLQLR